MARLVDRGYNAEISSVDLDPAPGYQDAGRFALFGNRLWFNGLSQFGQAGNFSGCGAFGQHPFFGGFIDGCLGLFQAIAGRFH